MLGNLGDMIDLGEVVRRAVKYLVEGIMVAIAAYAIPKKSLNLELELSTFSKVINAALSSLIEQRSEIANYSSKKLSQLTLDEIKDTSLSLGNPIYRGEVCEVISLFENGHLKILTNSETSIEIDEGEELFWPNYS